MLEINKIKGGNILSREEMHKKAIDYWKRSEEHSNKYRQYVLKDWLKWKRFLEVDQEVYKGIKRWTSRNDT